MQWTASAIAERLGGQVVGDATTIVTRVGPAETADSDTITFAESPSYLDSAIRSPAAVILAPLGSEANGRTLILASDARVAFSKLLALFDREPVREDGIHPTAVVHPTATIAPTATIGPNCVVDQEASIGERSVLEAGCAVGPRATIGQDSRLFPRVTVYHDCQIGDRVRIHSGTVIGADGFGYAFDQGVHRKIPQVGIVRIEDDVEVGANSAIDRGAMGPTIIGKGSKIDNLTQVGHNSVIGQHVILCGQVGLAGSTTIDDYAVLAGQVGVAGHLTIGKGAKIGAQSGIMRDVPPGTTWLGSPAFPDRETKRIFLAQRELPEALRRLKRLEKRDESADSNPS